MRAAYLAIALLAAVCTGAGAQGTREDYERANSLARRTRDTLFKASIEPRWIGNAGRFWYRLDLPEGRREFLLVDPAKPQRAPAFDHARLAESLGKALERRIDPERLPVDAISFAETGALIVETPGKAFEVDPASYALTERPAGRTGLLPLTRENAPRTSRPGGVETFITFTNRSGGDIELFWVDTEGERRSYGMLKDGESREQRTFAGHLWLAVRKDGPPLAAFLAAESRATAVITQNARADSGVRTAPPRPRRPAALSPDGKREVAIRSHNVFLKDLQTGAESALTTDGVEGDRYEGAPLWSPDSSRFLVFQVIPAQERKVHLVESSPRDQLQPKLRSIDYLKPGDRIEHRRPRLFEAATGNQIPVSDELFPNPWQISDVRWSPDSRELMFLYNQRGHQVMRLIGVDGATGKARAIIDEQAKTFIDWTNKVYLRRLEKTGEAIWMSERDGWNHLYLYDLASGRVKNQITKGEWVVRGVDRVDEEKRQVWFRAGGIRSGQDPYYVHYCRVNFDGTGLTVLTEGDGTHRVTFSPDGRYLVDTWSRVDSPPVTELRSAEDGRKILDLEKADASRLLATGIQLPERFAAKARDGVTDIYGVIIRPSRFDPAKKYPVIENIYAGPQGAFVPKAFLLPGQMHALAELGFIVVQIDGMGTNFRSKAFHDVCWKNLADAGFPDRILWLKAAAAKYPQMDLTRVGIYGGSAGGQSALGGLLQYGDFYKAAVADCGCHDNRMDKIWWNEQWMGWPVGEHYAAQSNVTMAPKLKGRLLLMVGELDTNVDPASTMQVVNALIRAGKDFELVVFPGAGHGAGSSPYGRRRLMDFFVRHLLNVVPPDWNAG